MSAGHDAGSSTDASLDAGSPESDADSSVSTEPDGGAPAEAAAEWVNTWDASSWDEDAATPASGDTWVSWMQGFTEKYCVECHHAGAPMMLDFTQLPNVVMWKDTIRCGITPSSGTWDTSWNCSPNFPPKQQFPLATSMIQPSDAERYRVIAWIGAGCP